MSDYGVQPGSKSRRREARRAKAAAVAPRPVDKLRPVVRCPTIKHNRRVREGRGFTIEELKVRIFHTETRSRVFSRARTRWGPTQHTQRD